MLCVVVVNDPIIFKNNRLPKNNQLIRSSINAYLMDCKFICQLLFGIGCCGELQYGPGTRAGLDKI